MGREIRGCTGQSRAVFPNGSHRENCSPAQRQLSSMSRSDATRWPASNGGYDVPWIASVVNEMEMPRIFACTQ